MLFSFHRSLEICRQFILKLKHNVAMNKIFRRIVNFYDKSPGFIARFFQPKFQYLYFSLLFSKKYLEIRKTFLV